jgi:hypothetical protein
MLNYMTLRPIPAKSVWSPKNPKQVQNETLVMDYVQEIVNTYDFIMVVERMDESLTVLALLTGLDLGTVLNADSKVAGEYLLTRSGTCKKQVKGKMSKGVQEFFATNIWKAMNYGDYVLYAAANRSLDLTIERIGRERFNDKLIEFKRLKSKALQVCGDKLGLGCSSDGVPLPDHKCYLRDFGCGYKCVDAMLLDNDEVL